MGWSQGAIPITGIFLMFLRISTQTAPRQYHFINQPVTWLEAQSYCREKYTDLATVDNMEDMNRLVKAIGSDVNVRVWIGLRRGPFRRWQWSLGIGTLQFSRWGESEPNNIKGNEWCGELVKEGTWNDHLCDSTKPSVCYQRTSDGRETYIYAQSQLSWVDGQSFCRTYFTDLASVRSEAENNAIIHEAQGQTVWIGLFSDSWRWSDRSNTSFRYWRKDGPYNQNCAVAAITNQGRWEDMPCGVRKSFVCHGGLKARRRVVKVTMSSDVDLTDHTLARDQLIRQLQAELGNRSVSDFKLSWRANEDGQIFQREEEKEKGGTKRTGC